MLTHTHKVVVITKLIIHLKLSRPTPCDTIRDMLTPLYPPLNLERLYNWYFGHAYYYNKKFKIVVFSSRNQYVKVIISMDSAK